MTLKWQGMTLSPQGLEAPEFMHRGAAVTPGLVWSTLRLSQCCQRQRASGLRGQQESVPQVWGGNSENRSQGCMARAPCSFFSFLLADVYLWDRMQCFHTCVQHGMIRLGQVAWSSPGMCITSLCWKSSKSSLLGILIYAINCCQSELLYYAQRCLLCHCTWTREKYSLQQRPATWRPKTLSIKVAPECGVTWHKKV